jgi:MFS family permease
VIAAGGLALVAIVPLAAIRGVDNLPAADHPGTTLVRGRLGLTSILTPTIMGRTFGVITSGFNISGMVGPLMFGFIMDRGAPQWVFGASAIVMILVAATAFFGDRRAARRRLAVVATEAT